MSNVKKPATDAESILLTLDQLGQTLDIMNNVVGRLRGYLHTHLREQESAQQQDVPDHAPNDHMLH